LTIEPLDPAAAGTPIPVAAHKLHVDIFRVEFDGGATSIQIIRIPALNV